MRFKMKTNGEVFSLRIESSMADDFQIPDWITQEVRFVCMINYIAEVVGTQAGGNNLLTISLISGNSITRRLDSGLVRWTKNPGR